MLAFQFHGVDQDYCMNISTITIVGDDAEREMMQYRAAYQSTLQYPFLIGQPNDLKSLQELAKQHTDSPSIIIRESMTMKASVWFANERLNAGSDDNEFDADELIGDWPDAATPQQMMLMHRNVSTMQPHAHVMLGLVKIALPWHLPAHVKYGGWNSCPPPAVHCALFRYWQELYGAEIIGMSADVVECMVSRPPRDRESALKLAWEQYCYCGDIIEQSPGSLTELAASLIDAKHWYFWWD